MAGWAQATVRGRFFFDHLGYAMAAVRVGERDALVVGEPTALEELPCCYTTTPPITEAGALPKVHLIADLEGDRLPEDDERLIYDDGASGSIGQSIGVLTPAGPVLVGDYWGAQLGTVYVIDPITREIVPVTGGYLEHCGADLGAADVDADGDPDLVSACLRDLSRQPGRIHTYQEVDGEWRALGRLEGTTPYAWFGRPTVGGFDLDQDGVPELAIGEEHVTDELESMVYLIPDPWRGHCTLEEVGAIALDNGFVPATLEVGDVDGDGVDELLIGQRGNVAWGLQPLPLPGAVQVVRDRPSEDMPVANTGWLTFEGVVPDEAFGTSVAVGDFNGDGCADVAVGAEGFDLSPSDAPGRVYVFDGPFAEGTVSAADADAVLEGSGPRDSFGHALAVGDYNGDGVDDLAVSAIFDSTGAVYEAGAAYVLPGRRE